MASSRKLHRILPTVLLLSVPFFAPGVEAAAKVRHMADANKFLVSGQTLPTGRQGAGMVLLKPLSMK